MNRNLQKGFTLIELLVVIAIIGILSAVVLASLNTARNKGKDASAKASMQAIRASAELFYNSATGNNTYGGEGVGTGVCIDTDVAKLITAVQAQLTPNTVTCTVASAGENFTASVMLKDETTFCVDSGGNSGVVPVAGITAGTSCQ